MRWRIFLALCALLASPTALADDALLQMLSERSSQLASISGTFKQYKTITMLPVPLESSGSFEYTRANGIRWHVSDPVDSKVHITDNGLVLDGRAGALPATDNAQALVARIFMSVVVGDMAVLREHFALKATGTGQKWQLVLTPKDAGFAEYLNRITLTGAEHTEQIEIDEHNGDHTRIELQTQASTNTPDAGGATP